MVRGLLAGLVAGVVTAGFAGLAFGTPSVRAHCAETEAVSTCRYEALDARGHVAARLVHHRPGTSFVGAVAVDSALRSHPRRPELEARLPATKVRDPSLQWILEAAAAPRSGPKEGLRWASRVPVRWTEGAPRLPDTYRTKVPRAEWLEARSIWTDAAVLFPKERAQLAASVEGWLVYAATAHGELQLVQDDIHGRLWVTRHAVIVERDGHHAWLYVHGHQNSGYAPLTRSSVRKAELRDGIVLVRMASRGPTPRLIVVDVQSGAFGEVDLHGQTYVRAPRVGRGVVDRWMVDEDALRLVRIEATATLDYQTLRRSLVRASGPMGPFVELAPGSAPR